MLDGEEEVEGRPGDIQFVDANSTFVHRCCHSSLARAKEDTNGANLARCGEGSIRRDGLFGRCGHSDWLLEAAEAAWSHGKGEQSCYFLFSRNQ